MVNWPFLLPSDFVPWLVHLFLGMLQLFPKPVVEDVEISIKIFQQYCIYILRCVYRQFRRGLCLVRAIFMPWWGISMNYHLIGKVWYVTSLIIQTMTVETGETPLAAHFIDSWWCFSRFFFPCLFPHSLTVCLALLGPAHRTIAGPRRWNWCFERLVDVSDLSQRSQSVPDKFSLLPVANCSPTCFFIPGGYRYWSKSNNSSCYTWNYVVLQQALRRRDQTARISIFRWSSSPYDMI